eukprot:TRINITY_DN14585_c0_g1_i9.p1 TRINITY_DN14585_c0_g1~~TRINITY_DN14585_c0_g1_i9.p1  ORF type:complete len:168 (+),score=16.63 TRINITY_DN14585_c0_g1_i9:2-505(+)
MYVCIYVCVYLCMCVSMYVCIYVCVYLCMCVSMYVCIYVCVYLCIVSVYVCIYAEDHVIGVECEAEGESEPTLTDRLVYVPYGANKAMFIQEFVRSKPLLCCGNSIGDRPFLELSQGVSLAVCSCPAESFEFPNEQRLQSEAVRRGWLTQHFEQDDLLSEAEAKSCQ